MNIAFDGDRATRRGASRASRLSRRDKIRRDIGSRISAGARARLFYEEAAQKAVAKARAE